MNGESGLAIRWIGCTVARAFGVGRFGAGVRVLSKRLASCVEVASFSVRSLGFAVLEGVLDLTSCAVAPAFFAAAPLAFFLDAAVFAAASLLLLLVFLAAAVFPCVFAAAALVVLLFAGVLLVAVFFTAVFFFAAAV
ncbi:MAG: hypothetical protein AAGG11_08275, partial [Pseudomonadota bacterium]